MGDRAAGFLLGGCAVERNVLWLDFHLAEVIQGMALDITYVLWGPA